MANIAPQLAKFNRVYWNHEVENPIHRNKKYIGKRIYTIVEHDYKEYLVHKVNGMRVPIPCGFHKVILDDEDHLLHHVYVNQFTYERFDKGEKIPFMVVVE